MIPKSRPWEMNEDRFYRFSKSVELLSDLSDKGHHGAFLSLLEMDAPVGEDNDTCFREVLDEVSAPPTQEITLNNVWFRKHLKRAMSDLPKREQYILIANVILERTYEEISKDLKIGTSRIGQLKERAIKKLKEELEDK